jgi:hypothetical protein
MITIFLIKEEILPLGEYAQSKINKIFDLSYSNIVNDYSGGYRIANIKTVFNQSFQDPQHMIIGSGWGQVYHFYGGKDVHLVVGDLFSYLGYGGIIGVMLYLVLTVRTFLIFRNAASLHQDSGLSLFGEGMMYVFSTITFTSLFDGYLLTPEYWMIIGISIFLERNISKYQKEAPDKETMKAVSLQ